MRGVRRSSIRGLAFAIKLFIVAMFGLPVLAFLYVGADKIDWFLPDDHGHHAKAWLRTRDVAPGDEVAIRILAQGGYKSVITTATARFHGAQQHVEGGTADWGMISSQDSNEDERKTTLRIPDDTPLGDGVIDIDLAGIEAVPSGESTYSNSEWTDHLKLPITIRSTSARTTRRLIDIALALLAWMVAATVSYWIVRTRRPAPPPTNQTSSVPYFRLVLIMLAIGLAGVIGQLVFARQILRTTTMQSSLFGMSLLVAWFASFGVGAWRGQRRARRDRNTK